LQLIKIIDRLKLDSIYYQELIHPDLSNYIEDAAYNQVFILSSIESTHQEEKKGISYLQKIKRNVAILKVDINCK
jgi:ABC-type Zn uptake system ZnuABC Zn-binding protein ZnuA